MLPGVELLLEDLLEFSFSTLVLRVGFAFEEVWGFITAECGVAFALRQVATVQVLDRVRVLGQLFPVGIHTWFVAHCFFGGGRFCKNRLFIHLL